MGQIPLLSFLVLALFLRSHLLGLCFHVYNDDDDCNLVSMVDLEEELLINEVRQNTFPKKVSPNSGSNYHLSESCPHSHSKAMRKCRKI